MYRAEEVDGSEWVGHGRRVKAMQRYVEETRAKKKKQGGVFEI